MEPDLSVDWALFVLKADDVNFFWRVISTSHENEWKEYDSIFVTRCSC